MIPVKNANSIAEVSITDRPLFDYRDAKAVIFPSHLQQRPVVRIIIQFFIDYRRSLSQYLLKNKILKQINYVSNGNH